MTTRAATAVAAAVLRYNNLILLCSAMRTPGVNGWCTFPTTTQQPPSHHYYLWRRVGADCIDIFLQLVGSIQRGLHRIDVASARLRLKLLAK